MVCKLDGSEDRLTILQQAILRNATHIIMEPRLLLSTDPESAQKGVLQTIGARGQIGASPGTHGTGLCVTVIARDSWLTLMSLPDYLRELITDQFKEIAVLDRALKNESQSGCIPIRYSDNNYTFLLRTQPRPLRERVATGIGQS